MRITILSIVATDAITSKLQAAAEELITSSRIERLTVSVSPDFSPSSCALTLRLQGSSQQVNAAHTQLITQCLAQAKSKNVQVLKRGTHSCQQPNPLLRRGVTLLQTHSITTS